MLGIGPSAEATYMRYAYAVLLRPLHCAGYDGQGGAVQTMSAIKVKRIYEPQDSSDGQRVLVDRIWPRGIGKEQAALTEWMKDVAPSTELRNWFQHLPERFAEFQRRYEAELSAPAAKLHVDRLLRWAAEGPLTLLYAAKDERHNQAVVLKQFLERGESE
jgi:uncharacterized protein YeaO (DUF488 family)